MRELKEREPIPKWKKNETKQWNVEIKKKRKESRGMGPGERS